MSLSQVQILATHTLLAVESGKNLSDELAHIIAQHPELSAQDKGMLQDIAYGCQRFSGSLKFMLGKLLNKPIDNKQLEHYLLVAMYQLNHTQNAPHAVVNETVNHIAKIGRGQYRSFANAILRRFQREKAHLNKLCKTHDVARHNLPIWLQTYLKNQYPKYWHNVAMAFQSRPPLTLRVNRRKMNAEDYLQILQTHGIEAKPLGDYALRLNEALPVSQLPQFYEGAVSVQDWGAQQAIALLNPQNGERILDACAAPGGKTGHILECADCDVTALDIDRKRLNRVQENLDRLGFQATLHCAPAENVSDWWDGKPFDAILADVPCTASGTIKRNPDIKWSRRATDALKTARQQEAMLDELWHTLKSGGRMLLATCSIFEEENGLQCAKFLQRHANAVLQTEQTLLPSEKQDGFYYALILKQ
ncbi:16S rRNA (cytosine(967)-C(5))-methyltransferase RsmB [Alysiella filiformis]|uniref:16S rRNA (cytosine(967)-C(5))-methyltransferase n=1 Tax=Alysiella filiformis DSM 16848 TaxID=1120981 RepID=A0A286EDU0_9NEIS|nr:16S rRNA (cytosine(967)-C(5))-methyltransferase RsmB [Alysiella filiformis]QMT31684.1 16S rRNA (cytosine(967)-C(5))-methyltransferase RsmB [Alysiella filiformis]UBQ55307.1 16S rRNA (cytosine(967)-C(5))-methyltransferase RsmB [Alysiella filiformis DSM 16848]SOD69070.1 16S rRNA (cytosine967-C5)-methyltransferase [Alysiella filiformis DSM 16848]